MKFLLALIEVLPATLLVAAEAFVSAFVAGWLVLAPLLSAPVIDWAALAVALAGAGAAGVLFGRQALRVRPSVASASDGSPA